MAPSDLWDLAENTKGSSLGRGGTGLQVPVSVHADVCACCLSELAVGRGAALPEHSLLQCPESGAVVCPSSPGHPSSSPCPKLSRLRETLYRGLGLCFSATGQGLGEQLSPAVALFPLHPTSLCLVHLLLPSGLGQKRQGRRSAGPALGGGSWTRLPLSFPAVAHWCPRCSLSRGPSVPKLQPIRRALKLISLWSAWTLKKCLM